MACAAPDIPSASVATGSPIHPLACGEDEPDLPTWEERLRASNPGEITRTRLEGDELKAVVDAYNLIPPQTFMTADAAFIFARPRIPRVALAFVEGGCVVASGTIGLPLLMQWLRNASGTPLPPPGSREA